jgi:hypothetical protein
MHIFCSLIMLLSLGLAAWVDKLETSNTRRDQQLEWKCSWCFGVKQGTAKDAVDGIDLVKRLGYNAIVINGGSPEFKNKIFTYSKEQKISVYVVLNPIYGEWGWQKQPGVQLPVDCLQNYKDMEKLNNPATSDDVRYAGPWLCPDRPEVRRYAADLATAILINDKPDGVALDFVGYKNYSACECDYSNVERARFAKGHPGLSKEHFRREFSLQNLEALYEGVRTAVQAVNPRAKIAAHVYPPFNPEPLYGNRLAVDYPAQTVAWFFAPHWPLEKVAARCREIKQTEHKYHDYVTGTGFIGIYLDGKNNRNAERFRAEIHAIKCAGLKGICITGFSNILEDSELTKVMIEELGGQ